MITSALRLYFTPTKLKIEQFKMRVAHNSKFKTQNSKLKLPPTRQHKPTAAATEELATQIQGIEGIREVGALLQG